MISLRVLFFVTLVVRGIASRGIASDYKVDITPLEAVRRIGDQLTVLCKVSYPIDICRMTVGGTPYRLIPTNLQGDIVYAGQGLKAGECGAFIRNVKEEYNGIIACFVARLQSSIYHEHSSSSELVGTMSLRVARSPVPDKKIKETPVVLVNKTIDDSPGADNKTSEDAPGADNKASDESVPVVTIIVLAVVLVVGVILSFLITILIIKCRRVKSNTAELPQTYVPENPFYVNLLFRKQCQQEIYEREHHYEEIN